MAKGGKAQWFVAVLGGVEWSEDPHVDPVAGQYLAQSPNHIGQTAYLGKGKDFRGDETNFH